MIFSYTKPWIWGRADPVATPCWRQSGHRTTLTSKYIYIYIFNIFKILETVYLEEKSDYPEKK